MGGGLRNNPKETMRKASQFSTKLTDYQKENMKNEI